MQHTTSRDYYRALGVSSTASSEEIRGAFRRLARTHHPDLNPQDRQAAARFKEINEAHEILSDPGKRRQYDERRARRTVPAEWPGPLFGRFEAGFAQQRFQLDDLLGDILGFGSTRSELLDAALGAHRPPPRSERQPRRGQDAEAEIVLSLEEAARGTTGTLEVTAPFGRRQVRVCIPAGVAHGALVRAAGLGTAGVAGGAAGDLLLRVSILAHPVFRRVGDHLHVRVEVPSDLARVGGAVGVPTLGGQRARLDVPPGTETGVRLRLRGLGMPRLGCGGHGDLVAEVKVRPLQGRSRDDGVSAHTHPHPGEAPQHGG